MGKQITQEELDRGAQQFTKDIFYLKTHMMVMQRRIKGAGSDAERLKGCYKHVLVSEFVNKEYEDAVKRMIKQIQEADLIAPQLVAQNH